MRLCIHNVHPSLHKSICSNCATMISRKSSMCLWSSMLSKWSTCLWCLDQNRTFFFFLNCNLSLQWISDLQSNRFTNRSSCPCCPCCFRYMTCLRDLAAKVNKVERVEHNPVELTVEVPRPVVIEKTIEAFAAFATVFVLCSLYLSIFCTCNLHQNVLL